MKPLLIIEVAKSEIAEYSNHNNFNKVKHQLSHLV